MAYTDDAVKAKLSALNETQEGIVTVAQWIMFHRRHADRTAQLWSQRLSESTSSKRLNLIYLANEVIQQSKARKKNEFVLAFAPILGDAVANAYKSATNDIRQKIRRVIEVWRSRAIFDPPVQDAIEAKVDDIDKSQGPARKQGLGGSLLSSSSGGVPPELQPLVTLHNVLTKADSSAKPALTNSEAEFEKLTDPSALVPTPPVHAARLSSLLKTLATAEGAVSASIKARKALVEGLEKIVEANNAALASEEVRKFELQGRKEQIEAKKREVEDSIMRGLNAENPTDLDALAPGVDEPRRPKYESITPPPVESLTPTGTPPPMPFGGSNGTGNHTQQND
ncbi:DUF618-domain-containing protein, partial [Eremomyces bilateralis CBS 781.70]